MSVTYEVLEEFDGTRVTESPDPENEGEMIQITDNVRDIKVRFTQGDIVYERSVNVAYDEDGNYDEAQTLVWCQGHANGVEHKIRAGVIS